MYPQGGKGGAQAIIDAATLARLLAERARRRGGAERPMKPRGCRRPAASCCRTARRRRTSSSTRVEQRTGGKRFDKLEDVISQDELRTIFERYQKVAVIMFNKVGRAQG
jgi:hypothetical protein